MELSLQAMKTLSELMDHALDLDAAARAAWLDQLQNGPHAELLPHLRDMLARQADMDTAFLARPVGLDVSGATSASIPAMAGKPVPGARIGPYQLLREIGVGGMGAVWLAERVDGTLKRQVALKLPMIYLADALAERFARERDILAPLAHANIARLYDAGVSEAGQPYLALEYVEGKTITEHCDAAKLSVRQRLDRFLQVARAVQYAHANLVIHRDLKPSNILVTQDGQVRLLDFGIAKLLDQPGGQSGDTDLTRFAGSALTLDYASPEQVNGQPISTASDVYSLGVVLYHLLTGQKPYQLKRGSRGELEQAINEFEPPLMSQAARRGTVENAALRAKTVTGLASTLAGDLDTIVAKAMKKGPSARYSTVAGLAQDIERHLNGLPVEAQPDSWRYRAGKFIARNRLGVGAGFAVVAALTSGLAVALWQANVARAEATRADREAEVARSEKSRADAESQTAKHQSTRADTEAKFALEAATLAQAQAIRADRSAELAKNAEAKAKDSEALARKAEAQAKLAAISADQQAAAAKRETLRATTVQSYLTDLFNTNSNDQRNAIQVRTLNAKQLLDRGATRLESESTGDGAIDAALFNLFGNLYENLTEYPTSKRLHEKSITLAEKTYGKVSKEYANAILDLAWVENFDVPGKRLDLINEAEVTLRKVAPNSPLLGRALTIKARNVDRAKPELKLLAARESVQILDNHKSEIKLRAAAETALALAERESGNYEAGLKALQRSVDLFTQLSGVDSFEAGQALGGAGLTQRQLLQLRDSERSLTRAVEVLRPYYRDPVEATPFGRGLHLVRAGQGDPAAAQRVIESAYAKLQDSDSKVHPLKAGTSSVLATIATARGDTRASLLLGQRAMQERGTRNPNLMAADAISLANTAVGAGEFEIAEEMIRVAQKVQSEKALPALSVRTLERVVASLAAAKANGAAALPVEETAVATPPEEASTPLARMQAGLLRAKLSMRKADWVNVRVACEPWLASNSAYELPIYLRGEFLLVAAEAEHRLQGSRARALIDEASAIFERIDVPHSKRLARSRTLSAAIAVR